MFAFFCFRFRITSFVDGADINTLSNVPYKITKSIEGKRISNIFIYPTLQNSQNSDILLCHKLKKDGTAYIYENVPNGKNIFSISNEFPGKEEVIKKILAEGGYVSLNDKSAKYIVTNQKLNKKLIKKFTNLSSDHYVYGPKCALKYFSCMKSLGESQINFVEFSKSLSLFFILICFTRLSTSILYYIQDRKCDSCIFNSLNINELLLKIIPEIHNKSVISYPAKSGEIKATFGNKVSIETSTEKGTLLLENSGEKHPLNFIPWFVEQSFVHLISSADFMNLSMKTHNDCFSTIAKIFLLKSAYFFKSEDGKYTKICSETFGEEEVPTEVFENHKNEPFSTLEYKGKHYIIGTMPIRSKSYVLAVEKHEMRSQFDEYSFLYKFILVLVIWNEELAQKICEKVLLNYQDIIEAAHALFFIEINCETGKLIYRSKECVLNLNEDPTFIAAAKKVVKEGKSFSREVFHCTENGQKKCYSVSGTRKYDNVIGADIAMFVVEDVSDFFNIDDIISNQKDDFMLAKKLFGLHQYKIENGEFKAKTFFKEIEEIADHDEALSPEDKTAIENLKPSEKWAIHVNNRKNKSLYYQAICTADKAGFLYSTNEKTELNENLRITQTMLLFGEKRNIFKCRVISFDEKDEDTYCGAIPIIKFKKFQENLHPDFKDSLTYENLMEIKNEIIVKIKYFTKSENGYISYQITLQPVQDNRMLLFAVNDEENKRKTSLLDSANRLIKLALDYSDVHFWHFNPNSEIVYTDQPKLNKSVEIGWKTIQNNVLYDYQNEAIQAFTEALETSNGINKELLTMFDRPRWLLLRGIKSGPKKELNGIYIDLTELKETERITKQQKENLVEAAKTKVEFLKRMSQQVHHPTNEICSLLEILKGKKLSKEQEDLVSVIHASLIDLLEMLNNTIDFSKIEMNEDTIITETFSPFDLLSEMAVKYSRLAKKKGLDFFFEATPTTPIELHGDAMALLRTSQILLGAALKKTESGMIRLYLDYADGELNVKLYNTSGKNTDKEEELNIIQQRLKDPQSFSMNIDGIVGINITLISHLIKRVCGSINISVVPNESTLVEFSIPYKAIKVIEKRSQNNGTIAFLNGITFRSETRTKYLEHYGFNITSLSYDELTKEHEPIKALFANLYYKNNLDDLIQLQEKGFLNGVRIVVIIEDLEDIKKLKQPIDVLRTPPDYKQCHIILNELSKGCDFDTGLSKNIKLEKIDLNVLIIEEPNFMHYASDKLIESLGCTIKVSHREDKIVCDGFDVVVIWVEDSVSTDPMISSIKLIRSKSKTIPILCVTLSSQYADTTKCINAGATLVINPPLSAKSLLDAFNQLH